MLDFNRPGRENLLSPQEEAALVEYIQYNASHNFPLKRQDLRSVVLVCRTDIYNLQNNVFHRETDELNYWVCNV